MATYDFRIENIWDNGEFLSGATVVYLEDGREIDREEFVGSMEDAPGYTGTQLATSAAGAWLETQTYTIEERLGPFGIEWQREQDERIQGQYAMASVGYDPDDLPF